MAQSAFSTMQYTADAFVESAGAVLFDGPSRKVCLIHHLTKDEWYLPKGRRNVGENREAAALREVEEETGYKCRLFPVTIITRAPPPDETTHFPYVPGTYNYACEPFMVTHRILKDGALKIISWYIAAIDTDRDPVDGEAEFNARLFETDKAMDRLTYQTDRDVLQRAIDIFDRTYAKPPPYAKSPGVEWHI